MAAMWAGGCLFPNTSANTAGWQNTFMGVPGAAAFVFRCARGTRRPAAADATDFRTALVHQVASGKKQGRACQNHELSYCLMHFCNMALFEMPGNGALQKKHLYVRLPHAYSSHVYYFPEAGIFP